MTKVQSGLDVFHAGPLKSCRGARVGILSHQASVDSALRPIVSLLHARDVNITALFAPEHGLAGTAQDQVPIFQEQEAALNLPVYSLYGQERAPSASHLANVDVLVCDLQDVGSRYYTFVWTMSLAMQACAKYKKKFIVLDRPNPVGGAVLEGPTLDPHFASFVGLYPVPVRHGLTIGEMALWINEGLGVEADLEVVPMKGWRRAMYFEDTGLPWVLPSPNMPTIDTAVVYPGGCLIEGTNMSEGRGTTKPFEIVGAPYVNPEQLAALLNADNLPGVTFRACRFEPTFHKFQKESCGGVQVHVRDRRAFQPFLTYLALVQRTYDLYGSDFAWRSPPYEYETEKYPFDILCGTDIIRRAIEAGRPVKELVKNWQADHATFARERKPFLLYN